MKAAINRYQQALNAEESTDNPRHREDLILKYAPLVKHIAERMALRLPPNVLKEDLNSAGIVGLFNALEKFDPQKGVKFRTYAEHRIRGAMLDELRKMDWIPRSVREDIHRIEDAMKTLRTRLARDPEDTEVAEKLGLDLESYYRVIRRAQGVGLLSLDALAENGSAGAITKEGSASSTPYDELRIKEIKGTISKALKGLSEKERFVISLYYYDELTLKEIAAVLGLTESRISQIHSKAIILLRSRLRSFYES